MRSTRTARLLLDAPCDADLGALFEIMSDARLWAHFPSGRHTDPAATREMLGRATAAWTRDGLGPWTVRLAETGAILGTCGCSVRDEAFWNLGYRLAADAHGRGLATEAAQAAVDTARRTRPDLPVVAYMVEHNPVSARVAQRVGLELVHRGADQDNPDPSAIRLVFADRPLDDAQLAAAMR